MFEAWMDIRKFGVGLFFMPCKYCVYLVPGLLNYWAIISPYSINKYVFYQNCIKS